MAIAFAKYHGLGNDYIVMQDSATIDAGDGNDMIILTSTRSSVMPALRAHRDQIGAVGALAGAVVAFIGAEQLETLTEKLTKR